MRYLICLFGLGLITNFAFAKELPPNIVCRPPVSILADEGQCSGTTLLLPPLILNGNPADFLIENNAPNAFPIGTTAVAWILTDLDNNAFFCYQNVTVYDVEPPVLTCPNNLILNTNQGSCSVSAAILENGVSVTDNCENVQVTNDATTDIPSGNNIINWTAIDDSGNISTCEQTVQVRDNQAPIYDNCPANFSVELIENSCNPPVFWNEPTLTDNCGIALSNQSHFAENIFELGDTEVTYSAYDAYGNYAECQFTITVFDNTPPEFSFCPEDVQTEINSCESGAYVNFATPIVTDPCFFNYWVEDDWQPGDLFPTGTTTVKLNTTDLSGNLTTCAFDIIVKPKLEVLCSDVLEVSIGAGETAADIYWNVPQVATDCGNCATDSLPDYEFLGHFAGHNYFRYTLPKELWGFAEQFAEAQGGYLACINSEAENEFITSRMFPLTAAWIGLSDWETENDFVWTNGEPLTYTNWVGDSIPVFHEDRDYVLLYNDGEWYPNYSFEKERFILEIPCWDNGNGQISTEDSGVFGFGEYFINYSASDVCGNNCDCDLEIFVTEGNVAYCEMQANSTVWIESMTVANFTRNTGNDGGYGDHTDTEITAAPNDCYFALVPGGNDQFDPLYWRIWIDLNGDGDFYDADELIFEKTGIGTVQEFHSLSNNIPTEPTRMRVALSSNGLPAPCGNFHDGEVEDYLIKFAESTNLNINNDPCEAVEIAAFDAIIGDLEINLFWGVHSDLKTEKYQVLKSIDGVNFSILKEVEARNSNASEFYQLTDNQPIEGDNFYQVVGISQDDCYEASLISNVHFAVDLSAFFLFPNPANEAIFLNVEPFATASGHWEIVNELGQVLQMTSFENLPTKPLEIDTKDLPNGVYFLYFQAEGFRAQQRSFVVLN